MLRRPINRSIILLDNWSMTTRITHARWDEIPLDKVTEMVSRKTVAGASASLTQAYFKKGALVPLHPAAAEQFLYVLQGAVRVRTDREDFIIREGDVAVLPGGVLRQAESLDDTFVMVFEGASAPDRSTRPCPPDER